MNIPLIETAGIALRFSAPVDCWASRKAAQHQPTALAQHPDKTSIWRIERGFDFLGYYFSRGPLRLAQRMLQNHATRLHRHYEQQKTAPAGVARLDDYVTRWRRWCRAGLEMPGRSGLDSTYCASTDPLSGLRRPILD